MSVRSRLARLLVAVGATGAAGRLLMRSLASQVTAAGRAPRLRQRLLAVGEGEVLLSRDAVTQLRGSYGLRWSDGHGVVGEVIRADETTVLRPLLAVQSGSPRPGPCTFDHVDVGDPRSSHGLDFEEITLQSDAGCLPGWLVPGARSDVAVILAHGYRGSRESSLSFLPMLHELGVTCVVVSYRNDPGAPPSAGGHMHLGASEWRDLDAGIAYAAGAGATRIALYGWSMGGLIALRTAERSERRGLVSAIVLDAPVLDWRAAIAAVARQRRVPPLLVEPVCRLVERRIGATFDELAFVERASRLSVPVLLFHGALDPVVPIADSKELARRRPDLVELVVNEEAGHVCSFNVDPVGYAERLGGFLRRELALQPID